MKMFDVYPVYDVEIERGSGCYVFDKNDNKYLDYYGGHAVISIGHSHPSFVQALTEQAKKLTFYSNSVQIPLQNELASLLGEVSGYTDYQLFLCSSGAEANENALKLASFHTGKKTVLVFDKGFHGRTSATVAATDNLKIQAPINQGHSVLRVPLNDLEAVEKAFSSHTDLCAVLLEGIQGVGGIYEPDSEFLKGLQHLCQKHDTPLILDEIQSGYGRTGKFFAHQWAGIQPDLITVAKGMGNGFPIGGVLIHPKFKPEYGMLGTTFGGNHLACAAALAVLQVIEKEALLENAIQQGAYLGEQLQKLPAHIDIRGRGLMQAIELTSAAAPIRKELVITKKIFTGGSGNANTIRFLPPLTCSATQTDQLIAALSEVLARNN